MRYICVGWEGRELCYLVVDKLYSSCRKNILQHELVTSVGLNVLMLTACKFVDL